MTDKETEILQKHGEKIATLTSEIKNLHNWMKDDFTRFEKFINDNQARHSGVNGEIADLKTEMKIIKEKDSPRTLLITAIVVGLLNVSGLILVAVNFLT